MKPIGFLKDAAPLLCANATEGETEGIDRPSSRLCPGIAGLRISPEMMVGAERLERSTSCSQSRHSSQLSYAPNEDRIQQIFPPWSRAKNRCARSTPGGGLRYTARDVLRMSSPAVFLFHGVSGHARENWFPWMKAQLEQRGFSVVIPEFPHPDTPVLNEWIGAFAAFESATDARSIFVGHSLGSAFALRLLERRSAPIHTCLLAAPVWGVMGNDFDPVMRTFTEPPYDWKTIRRNAKHFSVLHGENDPYITQTLSKQLAAHLGVPLTIVSDGGHLNARAGFTAFPLLLETIAAMARDV